MTHEKSVPDLEKYQKHDQDAKHSHHKSINLLYHEIETAHTLDPIRVKSTDDPNVFFHSFHDFPPDFYKAEYYDVDSSTRHGHEGTKIHSLTDNGYYYYDDRR